MEIASKAKRGLFGRPDNERGRIGPAVWLALSGSAIVATIILASVATISSFKERALINSERELWTTAGLLARHFDKQFEDSETIAGDLVGRLNVPDMTSPGEFRNEMSKDAARHAIRSQGITALGDLSLFDARGDMIVWSRAQPAPRINISTRRYFERFALDPDAPSVLAETVRSLVNGELQAVISHKLVNKDGLFLGVLVRRIDLSHFSSFFSATALKPGSAISLFETNGTLLARYPRTDPLLGQQFPDIASFVAQVASGGRPTRREQTLADQETGLAAGATLVHFPGAIVATNTQDAALKDWNAQTDTTLLVAGLAAFMIASIFLLIIKRIVHESRNNESRLEAERERLDTALNNMLQGLVVYDVEGYVVSINRSYLEMFDLPPELTMRRLHFRDLILERCARGHFDGDVDAFCTKVLSEVSAMRVARTSSSAADGRTFLSINRPLIKGGWVATIEDTTDRTRLEHERDRNLSFVREIIDHIPSLITVKDAHTRRYLLINKIAEQYFGLHKAQIVGKTAFDFLPHAHATAVALEDDEMVSSRVDLVKGEHACSTPGLGERYVISKRIGVREPDGAVRYIIGVVDDVTERRHAIERIAHLAHYDALTDLPNRALFRAQIEDRWVSALQGKSFALLYIDIDGFKGINDTLGHDVGDSLLQHIATRLQSCLEPADLIARLGGDEFAVVKDGACSEDEIIRFVGKLHSELRRPYEISGHRLSSDASIGIALAPPDAGSLDELIRNADLAMYAAKFEGRRTSRFFDRSMTERARSKLLMEQDLREAMATAGLEIHYQPIIASSDGEIASYEALLRWRHPTRGMVSPAEFIPVAEDAGLIAQLGEWVLRAACFEAVKWSSAVRIAVNVSPLQLQSDVFALTVASALMEAGLDPHRLEIEITEAVLIRDDGAALSILHRVRDLGVKVALDDFGTGFSSLSYLRRFPFDRIKIDRCFIEDLEAPGSSAIVRAVVSIANACGMTTTAEGVETELQRDLLREIGCTHMQGYFFARPEPGSQVERVLQDRGHRQGQVMRQGEQRH